LEVDGETLARLLDTAVTMPAQGRPDRLIRQFRPAQNGKTGIRGLPGRPVGL
jgi:hypothetical protein